MGVGGYSGRQRFRRSRDGGDSKRHKIRQIWSQRICIVLVHIGNYEETDSTYTKEKTRADENLQKLRQI